MASGSRWARLLGPGTTGRRTAASLVGLATWLPVVAWLNIHVAELTAVDGPSMYPLINGDRHATLRRDVVLNYKWAPQEGLQRGMIVTLR